MASRHATRHDGVVPVALRPQADDIVCSPVYAASSVQFSHINSDVNDTTNTWPIDPLGPLSIYAAVGVAPLGSDQPVLLQCNHTGLTVYELNLCLGWSQPGYIWGSRQQ